MEVKGLQGLVYVSFQSKVDSFNVIIYSRGVFDYWA